MSTAFLISYVLLWILVVVLVVAIYALYHHFGQMYLTSRPGRQEQGPTVGKLLDAFTGTDLNDTTVAVPPAGTPVLVLFTSTTCKLCGQLREAIAQLSERDTTLPIVVLCEGDSRAVRAWASTLADVNSVSVVPDTRGRLTARFRVGILPFAAAVGSDGTVRLRGLVNTLADLEFFAQEARGTLPMVQTTHEGTPS